MIDDNEDERFVRRVVSGGQTGADRAALDAAMALGLDWGGWVPKGRLDENGVLPERYTNLVETEDARPETRTEMNVRDSDATVIFSHGALTGGSYYTQSRADAWSKPCLHVDLDRVSEADAELALREWLSRVRPEVLNVAGPRASRDAGIYDAVRRLLEAVLALQT